MSGEAEIDETLDYLYEQRDDYMHALEEIRDRHQPGHNEAENECRACGTEWPCKDYKIAKEALEP